MARKYRKTKRRRSSDTSWKSLKKRFQIRKRVRHFGLVLLVFSSVLLTLGAIYAWHYLSQPFASAAETFGTTVSWDGQQPLNLLWLEVEESEGEAVPLANLSVISLNPTSDHLTVFTLSLNYTINLSASLAGGLEQGDHQLHTVYGAGNLMEPKQGVELAAKAASYLLGVSIDGYLVVESSGLQQLGEHLGESDLKGYFTIGNVTQLPRVLLLARRYLRTNLSLGELARVVYFLCRVRSDRVKVIELDGDILADPGTVDTIVAPLVQDEGLVSERLKVQVLNGTVKPGLATFVARVVRNMGGEVIRVGNYERQDLTKGFLILNESGSYTAKRLARMFGVVDSHPPRSSVEKRADITIVLGLEEYERIF